MKKNYKILAICSIILLFATLSIYFIPSEKNFFVFKIKQIIPNSLKNLAKKTLFLIPEQKKQIELYKKKYENLQIELNLLKKDLGFKQSKEKSEINLKKIKLPFYNREKSQKSVAFIEFYESKIITISGTGQFLFSDLTDDVTKIKFKNIKTNLNKLILDKNFFDSELNEELGNVISIKDSLIIKNKIFISYSKLVNKKNRCYNVSILSADLNFEKLNFENFFNKLDCIEKPDAYHAGGRMIYLKKNNSMILTTGDMGLPILSQNDKSYYGKILEINLENLSINVISKGHRNPQGLTHVENSDIIISTEHGPIGGDEINLIIKGNNYGWPIASYGESDIDHLRSHQLNNFSEPLIFFTPSIGISEIIYVNNKMSDLNKKFILTSLKGDHNGGQIYILEFLKNENKMKILKQIIIGERIRDIKYLNESDTIYLALENTPALGILKLN